MHLSLVIDFEGGGSCKNRLFVAPKYYYAEVISLPNREEKLRKKVQGRRKEGLGHGVDCTGCPCSIFHFLRACPSIPGHVRPQVSKAKMCLRIVNFIC